MDLGSALTGAATGALAGYLSGWARRSQDDAKRRKAIATALHIELRWLDGQLRTLDGLTHPSQVHLEPLVKTFDMFRADLVLFDTRAVASLLRLRETVREVGMQIEEAHRVGMRGAAFDPRRERFDWEVRLRARLALMQMPDVQGALLRNGADVNQPNGPERVYSPPDLPAIPPSPFGD